VAKSAVTLTAGDETTLIYLPGEIIPYRTAVFEQSTIVEAAESSRVAIVEVLTPGRLASNERYAFSRLDLKTRVHVNGRLLLQDRALLEPGSKRLTSRGRAADYSVTASLILIGKRWTLPQAHPEGDVVSAAGQSDGYILVRILGPTAQQVNRLVIETICQAGFNIC
jgi:urease accessory protein